MEVLPIFGLLDQKIASWFTNDVPLIPTLWFATSIQACDRAYA